MKALPPSSEFRQFLLVPKCGKVPAQSYPLSYSITHKVIFQRPPVGQLPMWADMQLPLWHTKLISFLSCTQLSLDKSPPSFHGQDQVAGCVLPLPSPVESKEDILVSMLHVSVVLTLTELVPFAAKIKKCRWLFQTGTYLRTHWCPNFYYHLCSLLSLSSALQHCQVGIIGKEVGSFDPQSLRPYSKKEEDEIEVHSHINVWQLFMFYCIRHQLLRDLAKWIFAKIGQWVLIKRIL